MKLRPFAPLLLLVLSIPADGAVVKGKVMFLRGDGPSPVINETVVRLDAAGHAPTRPPSRSTMSLRGGTLIPRVLVVPADSTVTFQNDDRAPHHLIAVRAATSLDLGRVAAGSDSSRAFEAGVVWVSCRLHPGESAVVHLMETPYYGFADANGNFAFDVPPGSYTVTAWNEHAGTASSDIELGEDGAVTGATLLTIDARKREKP